MIQYYRILYHQRIQKYDIQKDRHNQKLRGAHEQQEEPRDPIRRRAERERYDDVQASAALRSPQKDPLCTMINYNKITMVRALESGHEIQGCQMQPASTYDKAKWRAQTVTRVHDQVTWFKYAGTGNDK